MAVVKRVRWTTVVQGALFVVLVAGLAYVLRCLDGGRGPWAEALSAIGTTAAAVVALLIATRDRSERKRELVDEQRAQARLVKITVSSRVMREMDSDGNPGADGYFVVEVRCLATLAIMDVELEAAEYVHDQDRIALPDLPSYMPRTYPYADADALPELSWRVRSVDADHQWLFERGRGDPANVVATVQFSDAHGKRWRRSSAGLVELIGDA